MTVQLRFPAMGTQAHVLVEGGEPDHVAHALGRIRELEQRWSRFIDDSEISRVNREAGTAVTVSADTLLLAERALDGARLTDGLFDATLLEPLIAAGYDRDFALLPTTPQEDTASVEPSPARGDDSAAIVVDRPASTVCVRAGTGLDSGGIGKGLAADLVAEELLTSGAEGVLVNLGGDLRAAGRAPGDGWTVTLDDPFDRRGQAITRVRVAEGGLATTSSRARRWYQGRTERHHLIDPDTGAPARSDLASVSVVAPDGCQAEVLAKAAFLTGSEDAGELLREHGATGVMVDSNGRLRFAPGAERILAPLESEAGDRQPSPRNATGDRPGSVRVRFR